MAHKKTQTVGFNATRRNSGPPVLLASVKPEGEARLFRDSSGGYLLETGAGTSRLSPQEAREAYAAMLRVEDLFLSIASSNPAPLADLIAA